MSASAAGVSILPVGASTPGQHARKIGGRQKNEERAEQRQEGPRVLADDILDLLRDAGDHDLKHRLAAVRPQRAAGGSRASRTTVRTSMMTQVVTTGRVIATGPRWKRTVLVSGEACISPPSAHAQRHRAGEQKADEGGEQRRRRRALRREQERRARRAMRPSVSATGRTSRFPRRDRSTSAAGGEIKETEGEACQAAIATARAEIEIRVSPSFVMHPLPGKCAADREPGHEQAQVQKIPMSKCRSSQRPAKMPIKVGVTMVQPSAPIIARFWPIERSPSRCQRARRSCRVLTASPSCSWFSGSCVMARDRRGAATPGPPGTAGVRSDFRKRQICRIAAR